jgi:hypothetical protein
VVPRAARTVPRHSYEPLRPARRAAMWCHNDLQDVQIVRYRTASAQLTIRGHCYIGEVARQDEAEP